MEHEDPPFPSGGAPGAVRFLGMLGAAALLAVVAAHRHPRGALEPWRPGPAALRPESLIGSVAPAAVGREQGGRPIAATPGSSAATGRPVR